MRKDKISIIFGDSITYGLHDREMCGWVNRLRNELELRTENNFIINLGIPGQNSTNINNRFELEIKNRYNDIDDFILIYAIGIKDALIITKEDNHKNIFKDNIKNIINISKKYTNKIYFIGLIEPNYEIRPEYKKRNVIYIDNEIKNICEQEKIEYIKIIDKVKNEFLVDGLHPNNKGHQIISNIILEKVYKNKGDINENI